MDEGDSEDEDESEDDIQYVTIRNIFQAPPGYVMCKPI